MMALVFLFITIHIINWQCIISPWFISEHLGTIDEFGAFNSIFILTEHLMCRLKRNMAQLYNCLGKGQKWLKSWMIWSSFAQTSLREPTNWNTKPNTCLNLKHQTHWWAFVVNARFEVVLLCDCTSFMLRHMHRGRRFFRILRVLVAVQDGFRMRLLPLPSQEHNQFGQSVHIMIWIY